MNRKLAFVAAASLAFITQSVFASTYISCDGCSYTKMQNTAIAHGVGTYVVGNVTSNGVHGFQVYIGSAPEVVGGTKAAASVNKLYANDIGTTSQENAAFADYVNFYNAAPAGYQKQFSLVIVPPGSPVGAPNSSIDASSGSIQHELQGTTSLGVKPMTAPAPGGGSVSYPTPGVNAYSVVNGGPNQNSFLGWLGSLNTFGISSEMTSAIEALSVFQFADSSKLPSLSFTITFSDGSHIGAYVDTTQQPPQIAINNKTAVDSHGNTIPASASAVSGAGRQNYDFSGAGNVTDHGNMKGQIGGFGINLPASPRFACVAVTDENGRTTTTCSAY